MTDKESLFPQPAPTPGRPLLGMTALVVEDSLYFCDALRLLCLHSGARIRRADCLRSARRHLQVYRPSVMIVDMGLPDGSGLDLIKEVGNGEPRVNVILGTSAREDGAELARAAGADGFLSKPVESLGVFQQTILENCPTETRPAGPRIMRADMVEPDPIAFREDMSHAASLLEDCHEGPVLDYVARFLEGVAHTARDGALEQAVQAILHGDSGAPAAPAKVARLAGLVQERLGERMVI